MRFQWPASYHGDKTLRLALCDRLIDLLHAELQPDDGMDQMTPLEQDLDTVTRSLDQLTQWRATRQPDPPQAEEDEGQSDEGGDDTAAHDDQSHQQQQAASSLPSKRQRSHKRLDSTPDNLVELLTEEIISARMRCCDFCA